MIKMVHGTRKPLAKTYSNEFKYLWVTSVLDGSEGYLVSKRIYSLVGSEMIAFQQNLMPKGNPKSLNQLSSLITPLEVVKQKNPADNNPPEDEDTELHGFDGEEILFIE